MTYPCSRCNMDEGSPICLQDNRCPRHSAQQSMKTPKEREEAFRRDLAELLAKHKAELDITDDGKSYGMHRGIAVVTMMSEWDEAGNQTAEYTEFRI